MYRAIVIFLLASCLLGCGPARTPDQVSRLDESTIEHFLGEFKNTWLEQGAGALSNFYRKDAVFQVTHSSGVQQEGGPELLKQTDDLINKYGVSIQEEILEKVVVVFDPEHAVVEQRVRETWLFDRRFNDLSLEVVSRIEIVLDDESPRISRLVRTVVNLTVLTDDRQENLVTYSEI